MADHQTPEWLNNIYQEVAPAHGRYESALRTAFAATLAAYVLLVLQTPMIAPGIYLIYLVSYDVPYLTFKTSLLELFYQCVGVALSLTLITVRGGFLELGLPAVIYRPSLVVATYELNQARPNRSSAGVADSTTTCLKRYAAVVLQRVQSLANHYFRSGYMTGHS